ncbi:MAG TPA: hypothetical protein VJ652_08135 [Noviherbaspirillum sp.]|nr:hypothetical protein [Noviherbaspirillum sp.]
MASKISQHNSEGELRFKAYYALSMLRIARRAAKNASKVRDDVIVSIMFSVACIEGFVNEVTHDVEDGAATAPGLERLDILRDCIAHLKFEYASILDRIQMIRKLSTGSEFQKGLPPYQDAVLLVKIRNALVHIRPDVVRTYGLDGQNARGMDRIENLLQQLEARKLISPVSSRHSRSWLQLIGTKKVAEWAVATATNLVVELATGLDADNYFGSARATLNILSHKNGFRSNG